jgi:hypothetical protein
MIWGPLVAWLIAHLIQLSLAYPDTMWGLFTFTLGAAGS